jgi:hypothetical protein
MATTTNFGWETPDDTDLVKDGAAAIRTALGGVDTSFVDLKGGTTGQVLAKASGTDLDFVWSNDAAGMTNPMTTTGDIIYSSSGSTPARLGIGTSGQVVGIAAGVPAWTTPSAATASVSLIGTGTLSGASLTLSSLSSYDQIIVIFLNLNFAADGQMRARINDDSSSNYWGVGFSQTGSTSNRALQGGDDSITSASQLDTGANGNEFAFTFTNCKAAGFTNYTFTGSYKDFANARTGEAVTGGVHAVSAAVSSLVFSNNGGNFTGGNYRIYGG